MIAHEPTGPRDFLTTAGIFAVVAVVVGIGCLLALAAIQASVAPPIDPEDDAVWVRIAAQAITFDDIDLVRDASRQGVVDALGPPVRVRRDPMRLGAECREAYVYAVANHGERIPIALCFDDRDRFSGMTFGHGMGFDLRSMSCCGPGHYLGVASVGVMVGIPVAFVAALLRRRRSERAILSGAPAGRRGGV